MTSAGIDSARARHQWGNARRAHFWRLNTALSSFGRCQAPVGAVGRFSALEGAPVSYTHLRCRRYA
eukprot:11213541-Alexandrium_andersonii.AAC.1